MHLFIAIVIPSTVDNSDAFESYLDKLFKAGPRYKVEVPCPCTKTGQATRPDCPKCKGRGTRIRWRSAGRYDEIGTGGRFEGCMDPKAKENWIDVWRGIELLSKDPEYFFHCVVTPDGQWHMLNWAEWSRIIRTRDKGLKTAMIRKKQVALLKPYEPDWLLGFDWHE